MNKNITFSTLAILLASVLTYGQVKYLDPTGSYILKGRKLKEGEKGSNGEVNGKLISKDRLAISFHYNVGYPSYNSGSFVDTLDYKDNKAIYTYNEAEDSTKCKLTFTFQEKAVFLKHEANNFNYSCGFGIGVIASGTMPKASARVPEIKDYWENRE